MKTLKRFHILLITLCLSIAAIAQEKAEFSYICPVPGSSNINPENAIALRHGAVIEASSLRSSTITARSTERGEISGTTKLSVDGKTIIFTPDRPFSYDETIYIDVNEGIRTIDGIELAGFSFDFRIKKQDTYPLLQEFYRKQSETEDAAFFNVEKTDDQPVAKRPTQEYPENYPAPVVTEYDNPTPGYTFVSPNGFRTAPYGKYNVIMDNYGTPVYYRDWHSSSRDFKMVPGNRMASSEHSRRDPVINKYLVYNSHFEIVDTLMMGNGYHVDAHDMLLTEDGYYFMMAYDPQLIDMSQIVEGGDTNATVTGFIIQQLDPADNVIFQWRSWDHFEITDAPHEDMTSDDIDYVHGNAFEIDNDGNLLLSSRHLEEITKIDLNTGNVIWRFGPNATQNMFTFTNDTIGFSHQHDIRRIANGNITLYDNGNYHDPRFSQSVEYEIDEVNLTATLVWNYINEPMVYGGATGSTQRLENGNTLINWGATWPIVLTETTADHNKTWEVEWPTNARHYRGLKYDWVSDLFEPGVDTIDYGVYDDYVAWPRIFTIKNNSDEEIQITSTHNHWDSYSVVTVLPLAIPPGESAQMTVNFFPTMDGQINDVLTLNYDTFILDTLPMRISRQVHLMGYVNDETAPKADIFPANAAENVPQDAKVVITFNEPVTRADGSVIKYTDLSGVVVFKESNGEEVAYTATVDAWKTKVTLTPDTLKPMTEYHAEVLANSIADKDGNVMSAAQVSTFTTANPEGINENILEHITIYPNPTDGKVFLEIQKYKLQLARVLDIQGRKIMDLDLNGQSRISFDLNNHPGGIYFVELQLEGMQEPVSVKLIKN